MALFENFPYTNLHELNLDWIVNELNRLKDTQVLSVNGETGDVILYKNATVEFPAVTDNHWSIIRMADGTWRGIMFGNDDIAYVVHGNLISQLYSSNNQPPYPVTRVNGQTGDIVLYSEQYVQLPSLTGEEIRNWNLYRTINDTVYGIQFDDTGSAYIMDGQNRYKIYDEHDAPPYPVSSVNGQTGAVALFGDLAGKISFPAITDADIHNVGLSRILNQTEYGLFISDTGKVSLKVGANTYDVFTANNPGLVESTASAELQIAQDSPTSVWGLMRDTGTDGDSIGIVFDNGATPAAFLKYWNGTGFTSTQILTREDIPSSAGVVSVNGMNGSVVLYAGDINLASDDATTIYQALAGLSSTVEGLKPLLALVAVQSGSDWILPSGTNAASGDYIIVGNQIGYATDAITGGSTIISSSNWQVTPEGSLNNLEHIILGSLEPDSGAGTINSHLSSDSEISCLKSGHIVTVTLNIMVASGQGSTSWLTVGSIPSRFRPTQDINFAGAAVDDSAIRLLINSSGNVRMSKSSAHEATWVSAAVTYII